MITDEVEVCLLANKFKDMVMKEAWKVWLRLPSHTRTWVSLEDIVQDGMAKLMTEVIPKWDGIEQKLSSYVYVSLTHHLDECYTCKFAGRGRRWYRRRNERNTIAIEDLIVSNRERRTCWDVLHSLAESVVYSELHPCWVVPMLLQIHTSASDSLKTEMVHWFVTGERYRLTTQKFVRASTEFMELADETGLESDDCRHLFRSPECMGELTRKLAYA